MRREAYHGDLAPPQSRIVGVNSLQQRDPPQREPEECRPIDRPCMHSYTDFRNPTARQACKFDAASASNLLLPTGCIECPDDNCRPRNCLTEAYSMLSRCLQTLHRILHLCARFRLCPSGATVAPSSAQARSNSSVVASSSSELCAPVRDVSEVLARADHVAAATTECDPRTPGRLRRTALVSRRRGPLAMTQETRRLQPGDWVTACGQL